MMPYLKIEAPNNQDLTILVQEGKEGIMSKGVRVYEGLIRGHELADHFSIESSSTFYPETLKRQRDLEKSRSKKLIEYFNDREDTVLPSITIFVSELEIEEEVLLRGKKVIAATIPATADRLIADGQNRCNLYQNQTDPEILTQTLGVKIICTNTETLEDTSDVIRQLFSDYHSKLIKPKAALNLYYDSSAPYCSLLRRFLDINIHGEPLKNFVSTTGNSNKKQFMLYNQLSQLIGLFTKTTPARINTILTKRPEEEDVLFERISAPIESLFSALPMYSANSNCHDYMFTKAIFLKACMYVVRSILEESLEDETPPDWSRINKISELPLLNIGDKFWVSAGAVKAHTEENKGNEFTMIPKSEVYLARRLCRFLKIHPCEAI